jgi:hypothetical protein
MSAPTSVEIGNLESELSKLLHQWFSYYSNHIYHYKALDKTEHQLLFYASFTNLFSRSFCDETHLLAEKLFKKNKNKRAWPPFCNHVFIKILDWSLNGINLKDNNKEKQIFDRFILMTYSQNPAIKKIGQQYLFCLLNKRNSADKELINAVLLSCSQNLKHQVIAPGLLRTDAALPSFSIDYLVSMLTFVNVPKKIRFALLLQAIKPVHNDVKELTRYNKGKSLFFYKCGNPFYKYYRQLLTEGLETYNSLHGKNLGIQLQLHALPVNGVDLKMLRETNRILTEIIFTQHMISDLDLQKILNSKKVVEITKGEPVVQVEPPSSPNKSIRT